MKDAALLIMDVQKATLQSLKDPNYYLHALARAIKTARGKGIPVMYVVVGFRKGFPEVSENNKAFSHIKSAGSPLDTREACQIPASIGPRDGELLFTKKRFSAFVGSDLEVVLRSGGIQHLILAGISTSGVVLSTLREGADKDFRLTVLADGCEDRDEQVHQLLLTKVFPRQADILTIDDWCQGLEETNQ